MKRAWAAILFCLGAGSCPGHPDARAERTLPSADEWNDALRDRVVADIGTLVPKHFAHWQAVPGHDFDARLAEYRDAARRAADRPAFSRLTQHFIASLHNGHTRFSDDALRAADPGHLGFSLRHVAGAWVVTESRRRGLPQGSVVATIDGLPYEAFYRRNRDGVSASDERMRRHLLPYDSTLYPLRFELGLQDGTLVSVDRAQPVPAPPRPAVVEHRWLQGSETAYLRIGSFAESRHEREALDALSRDYASARIVIVDIRGNGGGNTPSRLGRAMLGRDWTGWRTKPPPVPVAAARRSIPREPRYLVLVDRGCASACDDFVMPMSLSPRALLIGETSAGSSGQPWFKDWGNGMQLVVGARRQWFPDGREFEGVGVAVDIEVEPRVEDYAPGAPDRVLECAGRVARDPTLRNC